MNVSQIVRMAKKIPDSPGGYIRTKSGNVALISDSQDDIDHVLNKLQVSPGTNPGTIAEPTRLKEQHNG
jgi:hypothetical protein